MSGFLSETTRDWLAVGGTVLAVAQTALAMVARRSPATRAHPGPPRWPAAPAEAGGILQRVAAELGTTPRVVGAWILGIGPGMTLVVVALTAVASGGEPAITIADDGGLVPGVAQLLQAVQLFAGTIMVLALMEAAWGVQGAVTRGLPLPLLLLVGAAGFGMLRLALGVADRVEALPAGLWTRLAFSTSQSLIIPSILCLAALPVTVISERIDRWALKPD